MKELIILAAVVSLGLFVYVFLLGDFNGAGMSVMQDTVTAEPAIP